MYKQHIAQQFTDKRSPFNLKTQLKKLIFEGDKQQVICKDPGTFTMVMSTFTQYEKYVSGLKTFMPSLTREPGIFPHVSDVRIERMIERV